MMEETSAMDRPQPMSSTSLVSLSSLIDDAKCYALVRVLLPAFPAIRAVSCARTRSRLPIAAPA